MLVSLIEQLFGLSGKVAIVTGGGQGLGKAIALALAGAGADVAVLARTSEKVRAVAEEIEALGRRSLAVSCDVTDPDSVNAAVEHVYGTFGRIDILVNGAGTISRTPAAEMSREDWDPVIDTNLSGTFWMSQAVARKMIPQKSGKIINIASATSAIGLPRRIAYSASKGGVTQLTRALAAEWSSLGICVNALAPGFFHTEINDVLFRDEAWRDTLVSRIAAGRPGKPEDLAGAVIYLASAASDYVTGHVLYVDGGYTTSDTI